MYNVIYLTFKDIAKTIKTYIMINIWIFIFSWLLTTIIFSFQRIESSFSYQYYFTKPVVMETIIPIFQKVEYTSNFQLINTDLDGGWVTFNNQEIKNNLKIVDMSESEVVINEKTYTLTTTDIERLEEPLNNANFVVQYDENIDVDTFFFTVKNH